MDATIWASASINLCDTLRRPRSSLSLDCVRRIDSHTIRDVLNKFLLSIDLSHSHTYTQKQSKLTHHPVCLVWQDVTNKREYSRFPPR